MNSEQKNTVTFKDYGELWNFNLQKIERIQLQLEQSIQNIEGKYTQFEAMYAELIEQLDILASIYSGFNIIQGAEYVLRLKSVLQSYRKKYTREGLNFNLIQFLLLKINEARQSSFEDFPGFSHKDESITVSAISTQDTSYTEKKYKWLTFERNRSWFIVAFNEMQIIKNENFPIISQEDPDYIKVDINNSIIRVKDIFTARLGENIPNYYVLLDTNAKNYAANRIGKQLYSDHDIITPCIKPFRLVGSNALSPGRIRLFGKNHIVLF